MRPRTEIDIGSIIGRIGEIKGCGFYTKSFREKSQTTECYYHIKSKAFPDCLMSWREHIKPAYSMEKCGKCGCWMLDATAVSIFERTSDLFRGLLKLYRVVWINCVSLVRTDYSSNFHGPYRASQ